MLYSFAIFAAAIGSIAPELLLPSDSRIITLLFDSLTLNRLIALAIAIPMAVPSYLGSTTVTSLNRLFKTP